MALEDLAMFRAIPTCTVFYPSDAVSTERAVELSANTKVVRHPVVDACVPSCIHNDVGITLCSNSIATFSGYVFHPNQQTRVWSHLLSRWEVWSGSSQGNNQYHDLALSSFCMKYPLVTTTRHTSLTALTSQVVRQSDKDHVTVIGAGVTLHEALAAADMLASEGKLTLPSSG